MGVKFVGPKEGDAVAVVARSVETKEGEVVPDDASEPVADADAESPDTSGDATIDGSGTTPTDTETPEEGEA
jgi:DNA gyrase subunit A